MKPKINLNILKKEVKAGLTDFEIAKKYGWNIVSIQNKRYCTLGIRKHKVERGALDWVKGKEFSKGVRITIELLEDDKL